MTEITFQSHPDVMIAGNTFRNVPTILQFEDTPMLEVGQFEPAGYGVRFPVYDADGRKLAVVSGNQIHLTEDGRNSNIVRKCDPNLTVCEVDGKPILELRREGAAALRGWAELYAPEGVLIKAHHTGVTGLLRDGGKALVAGGMVIQGCEFSNIKVGIHLHRPGWSG